MGKEKLPAGRMSAPPGTLRIHCFGSLEVRQDGILLDQWPRRKAKLILAALLLNPQGLSAMELVELIWPEEITSGGHTVVRVAVSALRKIFEPKLGSREESRYVSLDNERYKLVTDRVAFSDLTAFEEAYTRAEALRKSSPTEAAAAYNEALTLYRGTLLEDGLFEPFFEAERERFRRRAIAALTWLADHHLTSNDAAAAESALTRAIALSPCDEEPYTRLLKLHFSNGRPERVRQVYWDLRKSLKRQLGMAPSPDFEQLYRALA
jgi:DNA-binding SARP family transcriptional activator